MIYNEWVYFPPPKFSINTFGGYMYNNAQCKVKLHQHLSQFKGQTTALEFSRYYPHPE